MGFTCLHDMARCKELNISLFHWFFHFKSQCDYTLCILTGEIKLLKILLSKGVDVDSQSDAGTPLIWAAGHGQPDAVKVLLEHHANVSLHFVVHIIISSISSVSFCWSSILS